jgi:hypothetical protein
MIRTGLTTLFLALAVPLPGTADPITRPPLPDWQTDPAACAWHWREGGGIGLWAETCVFNGAIWQVVWDAARAAFLTRNGDAVLGIAVQGFALPPGSDIGALGETLIEAGFLDPEAPCAWQAVAPRPALRTMAFHVLAPIDPAALGPTASGEIPDPVCGPYGASTHGVRYVLTDLRWPDRAVFVEEGQERPLFDPASITLLP